MRFIILGMIAAGLLAACGGSSGGPRPQPGTGTAELFRFTPAHERELNNGHYVTPEACGQGTCYRVTYVPQDPGSPRITKGYKLARGAYHLVLSYEVRFADGFVPMLGGKLPGLASADKPDAGGGRPGGGDWSCRPMWGPDGSLQTYAYHAAMTGPYGDLGPTLAPLRVMDGRWHSVRLEVRVGHYCRLSVDGVRVSEQVPFIASAPADKLHFDTFFGGSDSRYTPPAPQMAWLAGIVVK